MKSGIGKKIERLRLFGPEMLEDPYPVYEELRRSDPIHWDETIGAWIVTRYDDVCAVLRDKRFSSDRVTPARTRFGEHPEFGPVFDILGKLMLQLDDPDHARIRKLVQTAFLRTAVERWNDRIKQRVDSLLDVAVANGSMEFMSGLAVPLPILVISEIMGIPEEDRERVKKWCDGFAIVAGNFYAHITDEQFEWGRRSIARFREYITERIAEIRDRPRDDLLSSLVIAEEQGDRLTPDELLANVILAINAGNETTTNLLGNGLAALLRHPDQFELLRGRPELAPSAIEEFLRYDSPVQFVGRIASREITLRGVPIGSGQLVITVLGAANRDPNRFPDPDRLDITRPENSHVAFGQGSHLCAGAHLARLEARIAFGTLLERYPAIELAEESTSHGPNFNFRGFKTLPLRLRSE